MGEDSRPLLWDEELRRQKGRRRQLWVKQDVTPAERGVGRRPATWGHVAGAEEEAGSALKCLRKRHVNVGLSQGLVVTTSVPDIRDRERQRPPHTHSLPDRFTLSFGHRQSSAGIPYTRIEVSAAS